MATIQRVSELPKASDRNDKVKKQCAECPFSRTCKPNALGGSHPATYIGQGMGPFWLPCHMDTDYDDPNWKHDQSKAQCAGAAIFRANAGISHKFPEQFIKRNADHESVFSTPAELLAHHLNLTEREAECFLMVYPPALLVQMELETVQLKMLMGVT